MADVNVTSESVNTTEFDFNDGTGENGTTTTPPAPGPPPVVLYGLYLYYNALEFSKFYTYLSYAVGIPGNIMALVILARLRPLNSTAVWLLALAFTDFLSLLIRLVTTDKLLPQKFEPPVCIVATIITLSTEYCNYIFLLAMTIERFIAVWFPLKMAFWCTPRRSAAGAIAVLLFIFLFEFHNIETHTGSNWRGCYTKQEYVAVWYDIIIDSVQTILYRMVPVFSVLLLNILIGVGLRRGRAIQKKISDEKAKEKMKQQRQIDRLLTAATVFFMLSVLPDILYRLTWRYWGDYATWHFSRAVLISINTFSALRIGNHAGNFYLYIVAATKFRQDVVHLLTCGRYGEHNGQKGSLVTGK